MAWVLVQWVEENTLSVVPSAWVIDPTPLPSVDGFPTKGTCYWRKKTNVLDTVLLAVSGIYNYNYYYIKYVIIIIII